MPFFEVVEFDGGLLIGARRNADDGRYYWRITPWIAPFYTIIPPRGGHPLGAHMLGADRRRALLGLEHQLPPQPRAHRRGAPAMQDGQGIHVTLRARAHSFPLANKANDYLMDRAAQPSGRTL